MPDCHPAVQALGLSLRRVRHAKGEGRDGALRAEADEDVCPHSLRASPRPRTRQHSGHRLAGCGRRTGGQAAASTGHGAALGPFPRRLPRRGRRRR